jgi:hypothetical protein
MTPEMMPAMMRRKPHGKSLVQERDEEPSRNGASNVLEGKRESLDNGPEGKTT